MAEERIGVERFNPGKVGFRSAAETVDKNKRVLYERIVIDLEETKKTVDVKITPGFDIANVWFEDIDAQLGTDFRIKFSEVYNPEIHVRKNDLFATPCQQVFITFNTQPAGSGRTAVMVFSNDSVWFRPERRNP